MAAASPELPILSRRQNQTPVNGAPHQTGEVGRHLRTAGSVSGGTSPRSCTGPPPSRPPPPHTTTCPPSPLSRWPTTATSISPSPRPRSPRPTTEEEEWGWSNDAWRRERALWMKMMDRVSNQSLVVPNREVSEAAWYCNNLLHNNFLATRCCFALSLGKPRSGTRWTTDDETATQAKRLSGSDRVRGANTGCSGCGEGWGTSTPCRRRQGHRCHHHCHRSSCNLPQFRQFFSRV